MKEENETNTAAEKTSSGTNKESGPFVWDEYKYRHELCWNLLFKITYTTTILSIIPYLNNDIIPQAKRLVFFTPLVGIVLSIVSGFRLRRELKLLDKIRTLHRHSQNNLYKDLSIDIYKPHDLAKGSHFTLHVTIYLIILTGLAVINFLILYCMF